MRRKFINQTKEDIILKTKKLLILHESTVEEKYKSLLENLSIYSMCLKTKLYKSNSIIKLVNSPLIENQNFATNFKPLNYWQVQDLIKETKVKLADLAMVTAPKNNINQNYIKGCLEDLSNYYREYQLTQQKRVFRKRVLKFFDNNMRVFCKLLNSPDFEKTLQMKSNFNQDLFLFKVSAIASWYFKVNSTKTP